MTTLLQQQVLLYMLLLALLLPRATYEERIEFKNTSEALKTLRSTCKEIVSQVVGVELIESKLKEQQEKPKNINELLKSSITREEKQKIKGLEQNAATSFSKSSEKTEIEHQNTKEEAQAKKKTNKNERIAKLIRKKTIENVSAWEKMHVQKRNSKLALNIPNKSMSENSKIVKEKHTENNTTKTESKFIKKQDKQINIIFKSDQELKTTSEAKPNRRIPNDSELEKKSKHKQKLLCLESERSEKIVKSSNNITHNIKTIAKDKAERRAAAALPRETSKSASNFSMKGNLPNSNPNNTQSSYVAATIKISSAIVVNGFSTNFNSSVRIKRQPQSTHTNVIQLPQLQLQPQAQAQHQTLDYHTQLGLPAVPMPKPPPFPNSFGNISPFGGSTSTKDMYKFPNAFAAGASSSSSSSCGGLLKQRYGIIQTPNFPRKFSVPLECVWIIDASELSATAAAADAASSSSSSSSSNISIVVYLTQLYVLGGLKFTEYMYYSDDYKVPAHRVFQLTEDDVTQVASVQFNSQYLEVRFTMSSLDGTHLRALDRLLDVYGFNITYEVQHEVKPYQCNTLQCRFLGHCYAREDFR